MVPLAANHFSFYHHHTAFQAIGISKYESKRSPVCTLFNIKKPDLLMENRLLYFESYAVLINYLFNYF